MNLRRSGWNWWAFLFGPFWYLTNRMFVKGFWLLILTILSCLLAMPFVWVYCGTRGNRDRYMFELDRASLIDINNIQGDKKSWRQSGSF